MTKTIKFSKSYDKLSKNDKAAIDNRHDELSAITPESRTAEQTEELKELVSYMGNGDDTPPTRDRQRNRATIAKTPEVKHFTDQLLSVKVTETGRFIVLEGTKGNLLLNRGYAKRFPITDIESRLLRKEEVFVSIETAQTISGVTTYSETVNGKNELYFHSATLEVFQNFRYLTENEIRDVKAHQKLSRVKIVAETVETVVKATGEIAGHPLELILKGLLDEALQD